MCKEELSQLQSELHQSAAEGQKQLTAVHKLETERSSLHDELKFVKNEVFNIAPKMNF